MALAACGEKPQVIQQMPAQGAPVAATAAGVPTQAAPVVVQQQSSESSMMPALLGGALGYMLGSANRQPAAPAQPVYQAPGHTRTIIRERVVERPAQVAQQPKPATVAPQLTQRTFQTSRPAPAPAAAPTAQRSFQSSRPVSTVRR